MSYFDKEMYEYVYVHLNDLKLSRLLTDSVISFWNPSLGIDLDALMEVILDREKENLF